MGVTSERKIMFQWKNYSMSLWILDSSPVHCLKVLLSPCKLDWIPNSSFLP